MMEMKVATSLTLYSFSCCTIKYYYYYCVILSRSRVCALFSDLSSSAFQKKKRNCLFVIISISKTRFAHISSRETNAHHSILNEVRFDSFFSPCRSLSLSLSVSVSFQKELEFEKARVFFSQFLSLFFPSKVWDLFKLGVLVLPCSREEISHYFYIARRRQRRKARSLAHAMFCRCAALL